MSIWEDMRALLADLDRTGLLRRPVEVESACGPRVRVDGRDLICLCSNDYLSLAADPALRSAAAAGVEAWGVGSGASRLVCGTTGAHRRLEEELAAFKRTETAVVTSTGWMANRVAICALAGAGDLVLCDKLDHASILDAARSCGATLRTYPHRDVGRARSLLDRHRSARRRCLIVTDSLFSMDGDFAPLDELVACKRDYDAQLLIDEAHATGVIGADGRGVAEAMGVEGEIDAVVGTLSKALGCAGGFVAGPAPLIDVIRNTGRAYVYTTAPPAAICEAARAALGIVRDQPQRRRRVLEMSAELRRRLAAAGANVGDSRSQILPILLGRAEDAMDVSRRLLDEGFLIPAIRPPSVPRGTSRLRCSVTAGHDPEELNRFADLLAGMLPESAKMS